MEWDEPHALEHCLEVQLPFLQEVLEEFTLVPLVVGETNPETVAEVLNEFRADRETLIVVSSDLSHYHSYDEAREIDEQTATLITGLDPSLQGNQACGCYAVNGLLLVARQQPLTPECLFLNNSGDTAGDKSRVVGYGAFAFH
jgi:AmmeMemoRadiSam system protein B